MNVCPGCGVVDPQLRLSWQSVTGALYIRGECSACQTWVKWIKKTPQSILLAGELPGELKAQADLSRQHREKHWRAERDGTLCGKPKKDGNPCRWDTSTEKCPWHS